MGNKPSDMGASLARPCYLLRGIWRLHRGVVRYTSRRVGGHSSLWWWWSVAVVVRWWSLQVVAKQ